MSGDPARLMRRRVLLVEDEALVAMDLQRTLEAVGALVIGPIATLPKAEAASQTETLDAAVLDIDLRGRDVFPAADRLADRGIPFLFHTGHGRRYDLAGRYPGVLVVKKPADPDHLVRVLASLL